MECRATEAATGRPAAAASFSSERMRAIRSSVLGAESTTCLATGVGLSRLASFKIVRGEALAGDSRGNGMRAVAATAPRNVRLDCMIAAPNDVAVYGPCTASGRVCDPALHR